MDIACSMPVMDDDRGRIMTLEELATYVKLSKSSLYKLCQAGKVPGTKVGRHWRFRRDIIDEWIATGVPSTQAYGRPEGDTPKGEV